MPALSTCVPPPPLSLHKALWKLYFGIPCILIMAAHALGQTAPCSTPAFAVFSSRRIRGFQGAHNLRKFLNFDHNSSASCTQFLANMNWLGKVWPDKDKHNYAGDSKDDIKILWFFFLLHILNNIKVLGLNFVLN